MRTTLNIDSELLRKAKVRAARDRTSLGAVIDDALRAALGGSTELDPTPRVELETDGGSGLVPGVDLEDREMIAQLLGDDEPPRAAR